MGSQYDREPVSVVEDLDPEPPGSERSRRVGELALGLVLLLGVLGWGGWQWWHDATVQAAYRAGSEAAARRDWDAARDAFLQASGYRDAGSRAADAARLAAGRDSHYAAATRALAEGHPLEALAATSELRMIQPDYRDAESLHERALQAAINDALAGTAASGISPVTGLQPGLYVGMGNGSTRLEGSDASSLVRAGAVEGSPGCVVYDVPSAVGRSLRLACIERGTVRTEALDSAVRPDDFDAYVAGPHGAWGLNVTADPTSVFHGIDTDEIRQRNRLQGALLNYEFTFLPAGHSAVRYPLPDLAAIVMTLGSEGSLLLAGPAAQYRGDQNELTPGMALYLARPDGSPLRPLHSQEGGFFAAQLSPDEHYALLTSYMPLPGSTGEEHRLLLIDTATGASKVLASATSYSESEYPMPRVGGAFIRGGPLDGKVVVARWAFEGELSLYDPAHPDQSLAGLPVSGYPASRVYAAGSAEGVAVVGWEISAGGDRSPSAVKVAVLRPGRESTLVDGPISEGEILASVAMRGDNAVYVTLRTGYPVNRRGPVRVRSLYAPEGAQKAQAQLVYTEPPYDWSQMSERSARPAFAWHLGKEGVTYSQDGLLQVAPYDSSPPVMLAPGMEALPFTGASHAEWVR